MGDEFLRWWVGDLLWWVARGVTLDLLQMAKRVGLQCEAAEYKDLSGKKSLTLDGIAIDDRRSHQA